MDMGGDCGDGQGGLVGMFPVVAVEKGYCGLSNQTIQFSIS